MRMRRRSARISFLVLVTGLTVAIPGAEAAFAAAPTISSFTPTSGPVGTTVEISGDNFTGPDPDVTSVKFNGTSATFTINNPHKVTATVPTGATTGTISVTNADGTATSATSFTVTAAPVPTITSFTPTSGPIGTSVVITGTGFTGATSVKFNGISATTFTVTNATHITATVPTGATTGPISITTAGGTATSATSFTVTVTGAPTITSFTPASGPVGTSVTITGTNFMGATAVKFNGVSATTFTVTNSTHINATVPAGATTGPISVTTPTGTGTSATNFTVTGTATTHERTISLDLRRHLIAVGLVTVNDGFGACASNVPVKIQRLRNGTWRTIDTTQTDAAGSYREQIGDRVGVYRAVAQRVELNNGVDVCVRDRSPRERHTH